LHCQVVELTETHLSLSCSLYHSFIHSFFLSFPTWNIGPLFGVSVITHTRHKVGLLWMSDQPVVETSTSMPRAGIEPATPATELPQTYTLDSAATRIGSVLYIYILHIRLTL
jgi:hypothetical protein